MGRSAKTLLVTLLVVGYLSIRLWDLTATCLWFDEVFSVHAAEHSWRELFAFVALDLIHPPLFYLLLKAWIAVGGEGLLWLRLFPVVWSVAAIVPFLMLCRALAVKFWPRMLALFLLAVNGCLIKYAQEVRMYSMLMCLSLVSLWLFVRYRNVGVGLVWLAIVNLLMVYTHYFGWFVIAAELAVCLADRKNLKALLAAAGVVFAGFLPWLAMVLHAASGDFALGQNIGWMARPNGRELAQFLFDLVEPFYFQATSISPASDYRVTVPLLLLGALAFALRLGRPLETGDRILALFAIVPAVLAFIASWLLPHSIWGTRHLIIVFAPALLLAADAVTSVRIAWLRTAAVTLVLLFSGFAFVNKVRSPGPVYSWCNWEPIAQLATERHAERIYVFEDAVAYHLWFALRRTQVRVTRVTGAGVAEDPAYFLPRGMAGVDVEAVESIGEPRLWIVYRSPSVDQAGPPLDRFAGNGYRVADTVVMPAMQEQTVLVMLEKID